MSSITRKASTTKKKSNGNGTAKAGRFVTTNSTARRSSAKSKPMTTEEVTLRAFRRTYNRLHPRKA
jgi:hypothetical protein